MRITTSKAVDPSKINQHKRLAMGQKPNTGAAKKGGKK